MHSRDLPQTAAQLIMTDRLSRLNMPPHDSDSSTLLKRKATDECHERCPKALRSGPDGTMITYARPIKACKRPTHQALVEPTDSCTLTSSCKSSRRTQGSRPLLALLDKKLVRVAMQRERAGRRLEQPSSLSQAGEQSKSHEEDAGPKAGNDGRS